MTSSIRLNRRALIGGTVGAYAAARLHDAGATAKTSSANVSRIIRVMPIEDKVSQMFCVGAWGSFMTYDFDAYLRALRPGGVIFNGANIGYSDDVRNFVRAVHDTNVGLTPLIAIDQEGGPVLRLPDDPVPGAVELGLQPDKAVRQLSRERAQFLNDYGFDVNFAPVADVAYRPTSFMIARSFGADPRVVATKVEDFVRGSRDGGMAGAAKHFPGHGRTPQDSHYTMPEVKLSIRGWRKTDALPFKSAAKAGVEMVMIGHLYYPKWEDAPTSLSPVAVATLRSELDFDGVVVTDDLGMGALANIDPYEVVDRAIRAGVDLLLYATTPVPIQDLMNHLLDRVKTGKVSEKRLDLSLHRILNVKAKRFVLAAPVFEHDSTSGSGEVKER